MIRDEVILSIVIPCYNAAEKLIVTLKKIEKEEKVQDGKVEFIIVDDCSKKEVYLKLKDYETKSSLNIIVEKNYKNLGPGASRNKGIESANGKYITFLDADDSFEQGFFEKVRELLELNPDCLVFDYHEVFDSGKKKNHSIFFKNCNEGYVELKWAFMFIRGAGWGKIYKKEIIEKNAVKFLDLTRNEDMPFTKIAISHCATIMYTKKLHYEYYQNENSLMHNSSLLNPQNSYDAFMHVYNNTHKIYINELEGIFILECFYSMSLSTTLYMNKKQWKKQIGELINLFPKMLYNKYFKSFSFRIRMFVFLSYFKLYGMVKFLNKMQNHYKKVCG